VDLVLTVLTAGVWCVCLRYRNAKKVHRAHVTLDPKHKDPSATILVLSIVMYLRGFTGLLALYMLQDEFNRLARAIR